MEDGPTKKDTPTSSQRSGPFNLSLTAKIESAKLKEQSQQELEGFAQMEDAVENLLDE